MIPTYEPKLNIPSAYFSNTIRWDQTRSQRMWQIVNAIATKSRYCEWWRRNIEYQTHSAKGMRRKIAWPCMKVIHTKAGWMLCWGSPIECRLQPLLLPPLAHIERVATLGGQYFSWPIACKGSYLTYLHVQSSNDHHQCLRNQLYPWASSWTIWPNGQPICSTAVVMIYCIVGLSLSDDFICSWHGFWSWVITVLNHHQWHCETTIPMVLLHQTTWWLQQRMSQSCTYHDRNYSTVQTFYTDGFSLQLISRTVNGSVRSDSWDGDRAVPIVHYTRFFHHTLSFTDPVLLAWQYYHMPVMDLPACRLRRHQMCTAQTCSSCRREFGTIWTMSNGELGNWSNLPMGGQ